MCAINAPSWINMVWKIFARVLDANTQKRIKIGALPRSMHATSWRKVDSWKWTGGALERRTRTLGRCVSRMCEYL